MIGSSPVKIWRNQSNVRGLLGKQGVIKSFTIIRVPPKGFENQAPYPVVIVDFGNKKHTGQLVDYKKSDVKIGTSVVAVLRRTKLPGNEDVIPYGVKFKPLT